MGFLIAFLALFLLVLAGVSFAAVKLFAVRDANGNVTAPGILSGCATAIAFVIIGILGLGAFVGGVVAISASKSVERVARSMPDMHVRAWREPGPTLHHSPDHPLHVVLQWKGHSEPTEWLMRKIGEINPDDDILVNVDYGHETAADPDGDAADDEEVTIVDLAFAADHRDLDELEEALREILPDLSLGEGLEIELRRAYHEELR